MPAISFLVAATALFAFQFTGTSDVGKDTPVPTHTQTMEVDLFDDPIDENLSSIELELDLFNMEES